MTNFRNIPYKNGVRNLREEPREAMRLESERAFYGRSSPVRIPEDTVAQNFKEVHEAPPGAQIKFGSNLKQRGPASNSPVPRRSIGRRPVSRGPRTASTLRKTLNRTFSLPVRLIRFLWAWILNDFEHGRELAGAAFEKILILIRLPVKIVFFLWQCLLTVLVSFASVLFYGALIALVLALLNSFFPLWNLMNLPANTTLGGIRATTSTIGDIHRSATVPERVAGIARELLIPSLDHEELMSLNNHSIFVRRIFSEAKLRTNSNKELAVINNGVEKATRNIQTLLPTLLDQWKRSLPWEGDLTAILRNLDTFTEWENTPGSKSAVSLREEPQVHRKLRIILSGILTGRLHVSAKKYLDKITPTITELKSFHDMIPKIKSLSERNHDFFIQNQERHISKRVEQGDIPGARAEKMFQELVSKGKVALLGEQKHLNSLGDQISRLYERLEVARIRLSGIFDKLEEDKLTASKWSWIKGAAQHTSIFKELQDELEKQKVSIIRTVESLSKAKQ